MIGLLINTGDCYQSSQVDCSVYSNNHLTDDSKITEYLCKFHTERLGISLTGLFTTALSGQRFKEMPVLFISRSWLAFRYTNYTYKPPFSSGTCHSDADAERLSVSTPWVIGG